MREIEQLIKDVSPSPHFDALEYVGASFKNQSLLTDEKIAEFIERLKKHEPVTKIIGNRGFWRNEFTITHDVLDPRSDTEAIVGAVCMHVKERWPDRRILDIGTGSGCILISLLWEYPCATGVGVDISEKALEVAKLNARQIQKEERERTKNIGLAEFIQRDFYDDDFAKDLGKFDIIVSNPPYIRTADIETLDPGVRLYDPLIALDGGKDGLKAYRALAKQLKNLINKGGLIFLEVGKGQGKSVIRLMKKAGYRLVDRFWDYAKIERILVFSYDEE